MVNTDDKYIKLVLDISKEISEYLNEDALVRFAEKHNIKKEYSKLELKQEVVAKRSLFFSKKKKYALHIVNREGQKRDEYDIKGLVLRRSEYPVYTKDCISKILDMILHHEKISFKGIAEYVSKINEDMLDRIYRGDKSVCRTSPYKDPKSYKKIPFHVIGAQLWNMLEYNYFVPGMRGYLFKIKGIDIMSAPKHVADNIHKMTPKNTCIVIPYEEPRLPDYYIIDVDSMLDYCWTKRYMELLEPVMINMEKYMKGL